VSEEEPPEAGDLRDPLAEAVPERVAESEPSPAEPFAPPPPRATSAALALLGCVVLVLGVVALLLVRSGGPPPTPEERARQPLNPLPKAPPTGLAATGAPLYEARCASCHGAHADGGAGPSLRARRVALSPDAVIAAVVAEGRPGMPAVTLSAEDEARLIAYLRYLQGL